MPRAVAVPVADTFALGATSTEIVREKRRRRRKKMIAKRDPRKPGDQAQPSNASQKMVAGGIGLTALGGELIGEGYDQKRSAKQGAQFAGKTHRMHRTVPHAGMQGMGRASRQSARESLNSGKHMMRVGKPILAAGAGLTAAGLINYNTRDKKKVGKSMDYSAFGVIHKKEKADSNTKALGTAAGLTAYSGASQLGAAKSHEFMHATGLSPASAGEAVKARKTGKYMMGPAAALTGAAVYSHKRKGGRSPLGGKKVSKSMQSAFGIDHGDDGST